MSDPVLGRYPIKEGELAVELKLQNLYQVFNQKDPSPFREKDLAKDVVDYLVSAFQEISLKKSIKIWVYVPEEDVAKARAMDVSEAVHSYFRYEKILMQKKIRFTIKRGFKSLLIGLSFLFLTTLLSSLFLTEHETLIESLLHEGLLVLGWVSMWYPINIFLYDWWPYKDLERIYSKISVSMIKVEGH